MSIQNNLQLNGLGPLPFGLVPAQLFMEVVDPTAANYNTLPYKNFQVGTLWLNKTNQNLWYLASIATTPTVHGNWVQIGGIGNVTTLTSNSGGAVSPLAGNINVVGDGTTITGVGVPGTHTITFSTVGTGVVSTLTGNSGGAVSPAAGNINVVGSGVITVVGNPGTSTLTVTPSGSISNSFVTDSGTATPALGIINFNARVASGSSVSFSGATNVVTLNVTDASSNTIVGNNAGNLTLSGSNNTGLGKSVLNASTTANNNTVVGSLSGALITTGGSNTIIGEGSGLLITTAANVTILGQGSGTALTTGGSNVIIGQGSGTGLTGAETNCLLINATGVTGGINQLAIGLPTGLADPFIHNSGAGTFVGQVCGNTAVAAASENAGFGDSTLRFLTTGTMNAGFGSNSLNNLLTGSFNTAVGRKSGFNYAGAESNNVILGCSFGTVGESNIMRLGNDGSIGGTTTAKSFISGVRGVTTDVNDAVAVLIDSAGQLGTTSSSLRYKDNVQDMGNASSNIMHLRPVTFNYKKSKAMQYGLIAEDVALVMPRLAVMDSEGNPETVKYHELPQLLLNELIKLEKRVKELEAKL